MGGSFIGNPYNEDYENDELDLARDSFTQEDFLQPDDDIVELVFNENQYGRDDPSPPDTEEEDDDEDFDDEEEVDEMDDQFLSTSDDDIDDEPVNNFQATMYLFAAIHDDYSDIDDYLSNSTVDSIKSSDSESD